MSRLVLLAAFLAASVASAAEPQQMTVWKLEAGYYMVSGSQIVAFPPSGPIVPPVPPTPPQSDMTKAIKEAVNAIPANDKRHETALKLTATYQMIAEQVRTDKIPLVSASEATSLISKVAIGSEATKWAAVMAIVNLELTKATSLSAAAGILDQAAAAVSSSVPDAGDMDAAAERYGFDWNTFMQFLMELLKVLLPLIVS